MSLDENNPGLEAKNPAHPRIAKWICRRLTLWSLGGIAFMGLLLLLGGYGPLSAQTPLNVAPFASCVHLPGRESIFGSLPITQADLRVLTSGTTDTLYMANVPLNDGSNAVALEFPWTVLLDKIIILGDGEQRRTTLKIAVQDAAGAWKMLDPRDWYARNGIPPIVVELEPKAIQALRFCVIRADSSLFNAIGVYTLVPRWQAWAAFLALTALLPFGCGVAAILSTLALGRIPLRFAQDKGMAVRMLAGVVVQLAAAVVWLSLPQSAMVDGVFVAVLASSAVGECVLLWRGPAVERRLVQLMSAATGLLVVCMMVDTNLVANRRAHPVDYLIPYVGSRLLAAQQPLGPEFAARPWLVHALFAPWEHVLGRFSYWGYIGFLAGMNSLALIPVALFAQRWGWGDGWLAAGAFALLPLHGIFNFVGQRPFCAAFCLLAVYWLLKHRWIAGGVSLAVAIGIHPGAVFLLPGVLVYALWFAKPTHGLTTAIKFISIPVAAYLLWSAFITSAYPNSRNMLFYYPLMTSFTPFDENKSWIQIVQELPVEHWRRLGVNRLSQLSHYLWTEPLSDPILDRFRWVSLPNALGAALLALLATRKTGPWRRDLAFLGLAVAAPLAFHHLYLGQPHAQFHITPVPFYGIGIIAAGLLAGCNTTATTACRCLVALVVLELFVRQCYPALVVYLHPEFRAEAPHNLLGMFSDDMFSYRCLVLLSPVYWSAVAWWVFANAAPEDTSDTSNGNEEPLR